MSLDSLFNFSIKNFSKILFDKINSFNDLDDGLISSDLEEQLSKEENRKKFKELLENRFSEKEINCVELSNGDVVYKG